MIIPLLQESWKNSAENSVLFFIQFPSVERKIAILSLVCIYLATALKVVDAGLTYLNVRGQKKRGRERKRRVVDHASCTYKNNRYFFKDVSGQRR